MSKFFQFFFRESSCLVFAAVLSQCRINAIPALSPFRGVHITGGRACGAMSPMGLPGSGRFRFSMDPPFVFSRRSWSSEFLEGHIGVFFSGDLLRRSRPSMSPGLHRRLPSHAYTSSWLYKSLLRRGGIELCSRRTNDG